MRREPQVLIESEPEALNPHFTRFPHANWYPLRSKTLWTSAATPPQLRLPDQPLILVGEQITLNLRHRIHGHADDNQQRRSAKVKRHRGVGNQNLRDQADDRKVDRAEHRDARKYVIDVFGGALAGANARNETAMLLKIVGGLGRVEHD